MITFRHSMDPANLQKRQMVKSVACPKCGAARWEKCIGVRGQKRSASHKVRWEAYRKTQEKHRGEENQ